jgi:phosphocarrier protein
MIVRAAAKYGAEFFIEKDHYQINGKSIIGVMTLAAEQGAELRLVFIGDDAQDAAHDVVTLFEDGFGEEL